MMDVVPQSGATTKGTKMADQDFGEFTVDVKVKPQPGVTAGEIPPALAKLLKDQHKSALDSADNELVLTAKDEDTAKKLALYARAWGAQQTPKLYIKKVPNGKQYPANVARLSVATWDKVPTENRAGRRAGQ